MTAKTKALLLKAKALVAFEKKVNEMYERIGAMIDDDNN